jgi:hypothetical protein
MTMRIISLLMPVGLLTPLSGSLDVSMGVAGLMVTPQGVTAGPAHWMSHSSSSGSSPLTRPAWTTTPRACSVPTDGSSTREGNT